MGVEMLGCAQHDRAVTHTDARINVFMCIIGPRWISYYPDYFVKNLNTHKATEHKMSETNVTLAIMSQGWQTYQNLLSEALAPLSVEQLALCAASNLRSINELACHIIAVRAGWFYHVLNVGDEDFNAFSL